MYNYLDFKIGIVTSLPFVLLKLGINILDSLKTMHFSVIFTVFSWTLQSETLILIFKLFHRKDLVHTYKNIPYFIEFFFSKYFQSSVIL